MIFPENANMLTKVFKNLKKKVEQFFLFAVYRHGLMHRANVKLFSLFHRCIIWERNCIDYLNW